MKSPISINQLPKYSPWPSRLMGIDDFRQEKRTEAKITEEYNDDKYAKLLAYQRIHPKASMERIRLANFGFPRGKKVISKNGELFLEDTRNALAAADTIFVERMSSIIEKRSVRSGPVYVVELGAGYGYNLYLLAKKYPNLFYMGGEYSRNAIMLGRQLLAKNRISVMPFNFYNERTYLRFMKGNTLIFTRQATEQLPSATCFVKILKKWRAKILDVVHFEPVFEFHDRATTLGLMRCKYTMINDYNRDLFSILKNARSHIQVLEKEYDLYGYHPFNPISFIHWRFLN